MKTETYLGGGLYASFDGFALICGHRERTVITGLL